MKQILFLYKIIAQETEDEAIGPDKVKTQVFLEELSQGIKLNPKEVDLLFTAISFVGSELLAPFKVLSVVGQLIVTLSTPSLSTTYGSFLLYGSF